MIRLSLAVVLLLTVLLGNAESVYAQTANPVSVDRFFTTPQPALQQNFPGTIYAIPCDPVSFPGCNNVGPPPASINLTFGIAGGIGNRVLNAVEVAGTRFEPATELLPPAGLPQRIEFRRGGVAPNRDLLFFQETLVNITTLNLAPGLVPSIGDAMLSNVINRGIDNVFNNVSETGGGDGQETANNIERIDYIIGAPGLNLADFNPDDVGFLILERGGNDPFRIAAITALDGLGDPANYGPLIEVGAGTWGNSTDVQLASTVLRRAAAGVGQFLPSHRVGNQFVRGIFFPITSLVDPATTPQIFGYSLFANDVNGAGTDLVNFADPVVFPTGTIGFGGNAPGGLDLVAGGFGLIRRTTIAPAGSLSLLKRITNLFGPANLPNFNQFVGDGAALTLLQTNGLGQGLDVITDPAVQAGNGIEYTVYLANSSTGTAANAVVCDQIPVGLTFDPNGYGPGLGIQAIAASSPPGPVVNYTNAADGDPGTFFAPGAALPPFCGTNQGNGAVVVNVADVAASQVGFIRFRTIVD